MGKAKAAGARAKAPAGARGGRARPNPNPFEVKVNRQKFQILGRKTRHDVGLPGVSRARAIQKVSGGPARRALPGACPLSWACVGAASAPHPPGSFGSAGCSSSQRARAPRCPTLGTDHHTTLLFPCVVFELILAQH